MNHELELTATTMTEMIEQIPTGKIVPVVGTAFDFNTPKKLNAAGLEMGYDDNFVFDDQDGELNYIGCLSENNSGRKIGNSYHPARHAALHRLLESGINHQR